MEISGKKLFIVVNVDWFFLSHRKEIAVKAKNIGFDVTILTSNTGRIDEISELGLKWIDLPINRSGLNIINEIKTILYLIKIYKTYKPDIVHHVTLKVSLYGTIAAYFSKINAVVNAISGLGFAISSNQSKFFSWIISFIIKIVFKLKKSIHFIFQNTDDTNYFKKINLINENNYTILNGSGVDLNLFYYTPPKEREIIKVLFSGRILKEKGIIEFIEAANILKEKYYNKIKFIIAGPLDSENRTSIDITTLNNLLIKDYIEYIGFHKNIITILQDSDIVVLPSYYREGIPKALIEACSIGRPIITTNWIGCKECVKDSENGFLVPIKDEILLAQRIDTLLENESLRKLMGEKSRKLAEEKFSIDIVIAKTISIYDYMLSNKLP